MKVRTYSLIKLMLAVFLSTLPLSEATAALLYTADFETSDTIISKSSYPPMYHSGNPPNIVTAESGITPKGGSHMMKTYLHRYNSNITFRTEAVAATDQGFNAMFEKGKDYWLGVSVFIPADWSMDYSGMKNGSPVEERLAGGIILQFHDRAYQNSAWRSGLPLVISHTKEGFRISNRAAGCRERPECVNNPEISNDILRVNELAPMQKGQWNDFVMHIKWSPNGDGILKVWVNGTLELNSVGPNYYNEHPTDTYPYFKMGLYQSSYGKSTWSEEIQWGTLERTLYHDELRIGDENSNYTEVMPIGAEGDVAGECDGVAGININDAICVINEVLTPSTPSKGECDGIEGVDISDVICTINKILGL